MRSARSRVARAPCGSGRRGFTLVEAVVSMLIVTILLVASLSAVGAIARSRGHTEVRARGPLLAQELMAEILGQAYDDPEWGGPTLGVEVGEWTGTRESYDDVDDYHGWSASPPEEADGTPLPDLTGWTRSVQVQWANALSPMEVGPSSSGMKRITVTVTRQNVEVARLTALRTIGWPEDAGVPEVLLVVTDASSPTDQDTARKALLESWGYQVAMISASEPQSAFDAAVAGADVAYVVEQQQSTALGTKLRDAPVGVVVEEAELRDLIGFSANRDWPSPTDTTEQVVNTHYITSTFAAGDLVIAATNVEVVTLGGNKADGLVILATIHFSGTHQPNLAVIETGGLLYGGGTAPARRVQLPWGRTGFDINNLNDDGRTIMKRAVEWAGEMEAP